VSEHASGGIDDIGGGRFADLGGVDNVSQKAQVDFGNRDAGILSRMRYRDRHVRPFAAERRRREGSPSSDALAEDRIARKIGAAVHRHRRARHPQLLAAGAVELEDLADRRLLVEQLGVIGLALGERGDAGARHPTDLAFHVGQR